MVFIGMFFNLLTQNLRTSFDSKLKLCVSVFNENFFIACSEKVMDTHVDWERHVSSAHGLSPTDAHNGILILDEANMVLRIPNPHRLDTLVTMIRESASGKQGKFHDTELKL